MPISRDRFRDGFTWDDWLERLGEEGAAWRARFDAAALGNLRAEYQSVPTPRYVACVFDPRSQAAREVVPIVARCCDQAGVVGGVDLRLFPVRDFPDVAAQYVAEADPTAPVCVVHDEDWSQVGVWRWRTDSIRPEDVAAHVASGFLDVLRGLTHRPWRGPRPSGEARPREAGSSPGAP